MEALPQEAREWICEVRLAQSLGFELDTAAVFADMRMRGDMRLCGWCGAWTELDSFGCYVYWCCPECGYVEDLEL